MDMRNIYGILEKIIRRKRGKHEDTFTTT